MTVYYNDIDPYCCAVLRKNIERGYLPQGDVDARDIRDITAEQLVGYQHIHLFAGIGGFPLGMARAGYPERLRTLTGGFPCQDISNAGKQAGITGERSGLWTEMHRLIRDLRPDYVLVENVAALLHRGIDTVLGDLAGSGYDAEWTRLSACSMGAPHMRERLFIVAYPRREHEWRRLPDRTSTKSSSRPAIQAIGCENRYIAQMVSTPDSGLRENWWRIEPDVDRMAPRIPRRMDRLAALGNAIVPQCAEHIARCIVAYEQAKERAA